VGTENEQIIIFPKKPDLNTETRFPTMDFGFFIPGGDKFFCIKQDWPDWFKSADFSKVCGV